jgi:ribonuclease HI
MRNREAIGQIDKWAVELNEFVINFLHWLSIESQTLVDFIADWTPSSQEDLVVHDEDV